MASSGLKENVIYNEYTYHRWQHKLCRGNRHDAKGVWHHQAGGIYQCELCAPHVMGDPLQTGGSSALLEIEGSGVMQDLIPDVGQLEFA